MMVLEHQPVNNNKKLTDFFTLDNIQSKRTALDCRSLPALSLGKSTDSSLKDPNNRKESLSAARRTKGSSSKQQQRRTPASTQTVRGKFNASMPNMTFNMDDESDSEFSDIEWTDGKQQNSKTKKKNAQSSPKRETDKSLKSLLERKELKAAMSRNAISDDDCIIKAQQRQQRRVSSMSVAKSLMSASSDDSSTFDANGMKKKRVLKVRASDVSKLPGRLRDTLASKSPSAVVDADDASCAFSVVSKNSIGALAPSRKDSDRSRSMSRRQTMEQALAPPAPPVRGVLRQRSMDGGPLMLMNPRQKPVGLNGVAARRQQSMSVVPSNSSSLRGRSVERYAPPTTNTSFVAPSGRVRSMSRVKRPARSGSFSEDEPSVKPLSPSKHSNLFMSNVLTDRLWASADNLNFVPDSFEAQGESPRRGVRRSQSDDAMMHSATPRRGLRRSRSIDPRAGAAEQVAAKTNAAKVACKPTKPPASSSRRSKSVDCRQPDVAAGRPALSSSSAMNSPSAKTDVAPSKPRSKSTSRKARPEELKPDEPSSPRRKSRPDASWRISETKDDETNAKSNETARSRSRVRRPTRGDGQVESSANDAAKVRSKSKSTRSSKEDIVERKQSSRPTGEEKGLRSSRSKSRPQSSRSKSVARDKSRDSRSVTNRQTSLTSSSPRDEQQCLNTPAPTTDGKSSSRSKSVARPSSKFNKESNASPTPSITSNPVGAILKTLADVPALDISPRKRLTRLLGKHHASSPKKSSEGNSLTSGSSLSKISRTDSQATSSTSASTYEPTELTPGAMSRIKDLGITPEQLALLNNMGLKIAERPSN
ncbi:hypothetical protein MPSEU_000415600 [Mayamaea pseudoterrestris]|nr:hypothetical protein MPSEU_000415600 [Mayamaea pseudoterrestris]